MYRKTYFLYPLEYNKDVLINKSASMSLFNNFYDSLLMSQRLKSRCLLFRKKILKNCGETKHLCFFPLDRSENIPALMWQSRTWWDHVLRASHVLPHWLLTHTWEANTNSSLYMRKMNPPNYLHWVHIGNSQLCTPPIECLLSSLWILAWFKKTLGWNIAL